MEYFTLKETAQKYNINIKKLESDSRSEKYKDLFEYAMHKVVRKHKWGIQEFDARCIVISSKNIGEYLRRKHIYSDMRSRTYNGWTNASVFCFKRGMNCQGCDLWARNCEQRAKECHLRKPPIKEKVLELVRDYGEPPQFLLDKV
jgi:hypothetical protein